MYIHFSILKMKLDSMRRMVDASLADENYRRVIQGAKGFRYQYALQSDEQPEDFISVSIWDSKADAMALFTSPGYAGIMGSVRDLLLSPPERHGYEVLGELEGLVRV
jgi:heme-degrading monooxygenase HmoA